MDIAFTIEYGIRLAAAAKEREMSVEEFVLDAIERALRPIESRRFGAAKDVLELEALWRGSDENDEREPDDRPSSRPAD